MRILFLVYHGFSDYSGISKKIHYQVKGLRENGHDVRLCYYGFAENGHRCRYVDGVILKDYGRNKLAAVRQYMSYGCIYDYCIREKIDFVYARSFMNANPWLANLFKKIQKVGVKAITEIPTYPYDSEFSPFIWKQPLRFVIDKWFRRYLYQYMDAMVDAAASEKAQKWAEQFSRTIECPVCHGARLNREALHFRLWDKNIYELSNMDIYELSDWMGEVENHLSERQLQISKEIIKEIRTRLKFLMDVGLDYLSLNRASASLSGGESQRIRLATQIGSQLVNVLYILDEPSIGLHQRDNMRLIKSLKELRDLGNTVLVVEHDKDMMLNADYVVDIGPLAGRRGGQIVFAGTPEEMLKTDTLTSQYLNGKLEITVPPTRRPGNGHELKLFGCKGNNLKNVDVSFPLNKLIIVTGVSGSGKSTLVNETLQPILSQHFYRSLKEPMAYDRIEGLEYVDKVVDVDQAPLGRTPRSNPATYTGVFSDIRNLYVGLPEAKIRGYKPGRFSFNVGGGRCEACGGNGYKSIVMNFLPDVLIPCEVCHGKRYNRETLEVRFRGKSIADVLDMTINQAVEFFENVPNILNKIKVLQDVGLGYIKLGQPSTTLSGGESQRVKLATELSKKDTGKTVYILDEPTTGLHFEDIRVLLGVLERLVDKGNTVIVIEHNMDVIKMADHIIDMGPDGGAKGGKILFEGTPEELAKTKIGYTASFLRQELKQ